jgi:hypothetical protein
MLLLLLLVVVLVVVVVVCMPSCHPQPHTPSSSIRAGHLVGVHLAPAAAFLLLLLLLLLVPTTMAAICLLLPSLLKPGHLQGKQSYLLRQVLLSYWMTCGSCRPTISTSHHTTTTTTTSSSS